MSQRKPAHLKWESWTDRQIREARDRGQFDDLPGTGKPIPGLDRPYDENWWIKGKLQREQLSLLPPGLAIRKEVEVVLDNLASIPYEAAVRRTFTELNDKITRADAAAIGPPSRLARFDVDAMVRRWEAARAEQQDAPASATPAQEDDPLPAEVRRSRRLLFARLRREQRRR